MQCIPGTRKITRAVNQKQHSTSYPTRLCYCHLTCGEKDIATWHISTFIPFQKSIFNLRSLKPRLCVERLKIFFLQLCGHMSILSALLVNAFPMCQWTCFPMFLCLSQFHKCSIVLSQGCCSKFCSELLSA